MVATLAARARTGVCVHVRMCVAVKECICYICCCFFRDTHSDDGFNSRFVNRAHTKDPSAAPSSSSSSRAAQISANLKSTSTSNSSSSSSASKYAWQTDAPVKSAYKQVNSGKRKRGGRGGEEDDVRGGKGNQKRSKHDLPGHVYAAKNAGGDMKKGKLDPFAFFSLDPKALNKRSKGKLGAYEGMITKKKHTAGKQKMPKAQRVARRKHRAESAQKEMQDRKNSKRRGRR
jgi:hypothetical protein